MKLPQADPVLIIVIGSLIGIILLVFVLITTDSRPTTIEEHKVTIHINKADLYVDTRGRWILQFEERKADLKPADMP